MGDFDSIANPLDKDGGKSINPPNDEKGFLGDLSRRIGEERREELKKNVSEERPEQKKEKLIHEINYSIPIPWEKINQEEIGEEAITMKEIVDFLTGKTSFKEFLPKAMELFFGNANDVEGLGVELDEDLSKIHPRQRADILEGLNRIDQKKASYKKKLMASALRGHIEYSLNQQGYIKQRTATPHIAYGPTKEGEKLKDYMDQAMWESIETRRILGPLNYEHSLPEGSYIHVDSHKYPIFLSMSDAPEEGVKVPIFEEQKGLESATKLDFLKNSLTPGDILFVTASEPKNKTFATTPLLNAWIKIIRQHQDPDFFATHTFVYLGDGQVAEIGFKGGTIWHIDEIIPEIYHEVAVGQIPGWTSDEGLQFAEKVRERIPEVKEYSAPQALEFAAEEIESLADHGRGGLIRTVLRAIGAAKKLEDGTQGVCSDLVTFGMQALIDTNPEIQNPLGPLKSIRTPLDLFKKVAILYSFEFSES